MPLGDNTGPTGQGPITGRPAGYCAGYGVPGYANPTQGRGFSGRGGRCRSFWGRGGGRGWRHRYYATGLPGWDRAPYGLPNWSSPAINPPHAAAYSRPDKEQELRILKDQADYFTENLEGIKKRIQKLEAKNESNE